VYGVLHKYNSSWVIIALLTRNRLQAIADSQTYFRQTACLYSLSIACQWPVLFINFFVCHRWPVVFVVFFAISTTKFIWFLFLYAIDDQLYLFFWFCLSSITNFIHVFLNFVGYRLSNLFIFLFAIYDQFYFLPITGFLKTLRSM